MTNYVTSTDGTRIAFDRFGQGPPVVIVGGLLSDREGGRPLAEQLAGRFTAIAYDRRGRGESGDTAPYAVAREVEDIGALIAEVGGRASVYGHSSGAGLALEAAAGGLPIDRLVLHEPPYGPADEEARRGATEFARRVEAAVVDGPAIDAIAMFLEAAGVPPEVVAEMSADPTKQALAPTMPYDIAVMGEIDRGGAIPEDRVRSITIPTLLLAGGASADFFRDTAARLAELLPDATYIVLDGQDHGADPRVVAPVVAVFLATDRGGRSL